MYLSISLSLYLSERSPDDLIEIVGPDLLGKLWYDQHFEPKGAKQKGAPKEYYLFPGFVDCTNKAKISQEIFPSVLTRGRGKGVFKCILLRKIMSQHLKTLAPTHGILDSTVDGMYDHPQGEVARQVYDKQGKNSLSNLLSDALGEFW